MLRVALERSAPGLGPAPPRRNSAPAHLVHPLLLFTMRPSGLLSTSHSPVPRLRQRRRAARSPEGDCTFLLNVNPKVDTAAKARRGFGSIRGAQTAIVRPTRTRRLTIAGTKRHSVPGPGNRPDRSCCRLRIYPEFLDNLDGPQRPVGAISWPRRGPNSVTSPDIFSRNFMIVDRTPVP